MLVVLPPPYPQPLHPLWVHPECFRLSARTRSTQACSSLQKDLVPTMIQSVDIALSLLSLSFASSLEILIR